jgi:hypothetical protein
MMPVRNLHQQKQKVLEGVGVPQELHHLPKQHQDDAVAELVLNQNQQMKKKRRKK